MIIDHPIHPIDREVVAELRRMAVSMKGSLTGPSAREFFDELMEKAPAAEAVTYEKSEVVACPDGGVGQPTLPLTPPSSISTVART